ncbi:MAG: PD40 domain-containing protein [Bacteroidales bacterium]|nr:PD40 domain-containing protein [Bacteroidales bacterium]
MQKKLNTIPGMLSYGFIVMLLIFLSTSCARKSDVKSVFRDYLTKKITLKGLTVIYPMANTLFPADFQAPTFRWEDNSGTSTDWCVFISDSSGNILLEGNVRTREWKPDSSKWEVLKQQTLGTGLLVTVIGHDSKYKNFSGSSQPFWISPDSVGSDIFYRAVTLPFSYAVRNVHTIEWYLGNVQGGKPRRMLDNMNVCANCHSFSKEGPTIAMDVDYGNDKGSYVVTTAKDTCSLVPGDIISWSNFKKEEGDPTFGLLSKISPSGKYVLSTVKDLSVFAAVDDNLAYSQLFFPIKGIIGIYDAETKQFSELKGANDPKYVQSNPEWSPDNKTVIFARTDTYINEKVRKSGTALLDISDVKEFMDGQKEFKFDLYAVDFNEGKGGTPRPLDGASFNGKSNYFPKYSPDGKWIVFCQSENFMLLQPDSKLYIMKADGTEPRLMNCNTGNMNSWHSWSPNGHWMVFSSKEGSLYTRLYLTHIDENGNDSPPILLENLVFDERAANIPEFFPGNADEFTSIKDDFSNTAPYYVAIASDNIQSQYYLRASRNLNKALALDPEYIDGYILRILLNSILQQMNSNVEKEEKKRAFSVVNDLIAKDRTNEEWKFLKANLLTSEGSYDQTLLLLNSIVAGSPKFYRAYELLATIYKKTGNTEKVLSTYDKMKKLVPANELDIDLSIATYYLSQKMVQKGMALLKSLAEKYPGNFELHETLYTAYLEQKDLKSAQKEVDFLLQEVPSNHTYYFMNSQIAEMTGNSAKARELKNMAYNYLKKELAKNDENIPLAFEEAGFLQSRNDLSGAVEVYTKILDVLPTNYRALKDKARLMLGLQQWEDAIGLYKVLLDNYPPEEEFYNNAAIAYINAGDYQSALDNFSNTLKINPANTDALYNRSKLYQLLGETQKAEQDMKNMDRILKATK